MSLSRKTHKFVDPCIVFSRVGRAYGNLGLSHESLGNYEEAVRHQEQHLSIAAEMNDKVAKTLAYSSLGKTDLISKILDIFNCSAFHHSRK